MLGDIYIYDKNLAAIGIIDNYKSVIWANRYNDLGDCEIYLPANSDSLLILEKGNYIGRPDDDMICRIVKIEIDTNAEEGNYLVVTGSDAKSFLDQRIIWDTMQCDGNLEAFIRQIVNDTLCVPEDSDRQLKKANGGRLFFLGQLAGFPEVNTEQVSYKNVGEKVREYCGTYHWGYKVVNGADGLEFAIYKGADRSEDIIFSERFENLATSVYVDDVTNMGNVALVGGEGEGPLRSRSVFGSADGVDRYERFVDAKDVARRITWDNLTSMYPTAASGGSGYITTEAGSYVYKMGTVDIQVVSEDQLQWLQDNFTGTVVVVAGNTFFRATNATIADLDTNTPTSETNVSLRDIIYSLYLLNRGAEHLAGFGEVVTFEGAVIPDITFTYKVDYSLGDIVTVENAYGISDKARIVEVVEVMDENGYSIEPKFEWLSNPNAE